MFDILLKKSELYGMQSDMIILKNKYSCKSFSVYAFMFLITLLINVSCKKEKDNAPPVISIELPQANITLNAVDSILVKATITDDNGPLAVSVYIADALMNPLTSSLLKNVSGNSLTIDQLYFFSNKYLETGTYYLVVHAEDGQNIENKMVKIQISAIPRVLKSVYVGVRDPSGVKIFCNDTSGNFSQVGSFSSSLVDLAINNYSQQLFLLNSSGVLSCYSLPDFQMEWERTGFNLPGFSFNGQLKEYEHLFYSTDANGYIKAFDETGTVRKVFNVSLGSPICFNFCDSKLLTYVLNTNNQNKYIKTLSSEGSTLNSYLVNYTPYEFFPISLNNVIVFGGNQGQAVMSTYNTQISLLSPFGNSLSGNFFDAVETPDDHYLLATSNDIRIIEKDYGYSTLYASGHRADKLKFEDISQTLYAVDSNNLTVFQYPYSQIMFSHDFSEKILFFDFLYNK